VVARTAESRLTKPHSQAKATTSRITAKISAFRGSMTPVTSGRFLVRSIRASMSRSTYMLMAWDPPAARVPPKTVANINQIDGSPPSATTIVGTVVTSRSSMMRGFVRAMYAPTLVRSDGRTGAYIGSRA
jgi:hypothetical protein